MYLDGTPFTKKKKKGLLLPIQPDVRCKERDTWPIGLLQWYYNVARTSCHLILA